MKLVPTGSIISSSRPQVGCGHFYCIPFTCNTDAEEMHAMVLAQFQLVFKCSPSFVTATDISGVFGMISSLSFQFPTQACLCAAYSTAA